MGKRSSFKRRKHDRYLTPMAPVLDLKPHLPQQFRFAEICAANGRLIDHLRLIGGHCVEAIDINPSRNDVAFGDALRWSPRYSQFGVLDYVITNPPWTRDILHPLIMRCIRRTPTWLLFDADWAHTRQAAPYLRYCRKVVSVGRVKWIESSKNTGKDNAAWYLFSQEDHGRTEFIGRAAV